MRTGQKVFGRIQTGDEEGITIERKRIELNN